jgi:hypothetical protein
MTTLPPLLLTSCVTVSAPSTQIQDKNNRIELTIKSIEKWLNISTHLKIIICDGSNYDFSSILSEKFPYHQIECLFFNNNSKSVALYGKGYGEGEIVQYALENSVFLNEADFFAKCTSKLWVDNFSECLYFWNGTFLCDCDFSYLKHFKLVEFKSVDTAFYMVDKLYYMENFLSAHLNVREKNRHWLEHCFKDIVIAKKMSKFMLPVAPIVRGVSGTQGSENNYSFTNKANDIIKRLLVRNNKRYANLIADNPGIKPHII